MQMISEFLENNYYFTSYQSFPVFDLIIRRAADIHMFLCSSTAHPKFVIWDERKTKPDYYQDHPKVIFIFHIVAV